MEKEAADVRTSLFEVFRTLEGPNTHSFLNSINLVHNKHVGPRTIDTSLGTSPTSLCDVIRGICMMSQSEVGLVTRLHRYICTNTITYGR